MHSTSYDWQFVPIAGRTFSDSGAANCVSNAPIPNPTHTPIAGLTPTSTRTPGPGATTSMHIGDLDGAGTRQGNKWIANVTVTVHDAKHRPLPNVTVTGKWSKGQCTINKSALRNGKNRVTFIVKNIVGSSFVYTSTNNHDSDGSSNGTRIVVRKPR
ncbi:MAG TPA: hypothetical protein VJ821_05195 [Anaerolineales bacterium]|nr:hypothetical protein [Anaerolineales bacterium]